MTDRLLRRSICAAIAALVVTRSLGAETPVYSTVEPYPLRAIIGLKTIDLRLAAKHVTGKPHLVAELIVHEGETVDKAQGAWNDGGTEVRFELRPSNYGLFRAVVSRGVVDSEVVFSTRYAVLRPLPKRYANTPASQFRFGVNTHFDHKLGDLEVLPQLVARGGFRWIRDTLGWGHVEREKEQCQIRDYNRAALENLKKHGVHALLCLCYGNKHYPHTSTEEAEGYGRYAEFAARELKDLVQTFEIWNEPNAFAKLSPQEYTRILKAGFEGVKKGNPAAFVVGMGGPAAGGWGGWYIPDVLKVGGQAWMDSFSIHPYSSPNTGEVGYPSRGGPSPRSSLDYLHRITLHLAENIRVARGVPRRPGVWITEMGWPTTQVSEEAQAQQIARFLIYCAARPDDIERTFIYDFLCDGTDPKNKEHTFGLVTHDYAPRPSYVAVATAARAVDGLPFLRRIKHEYDGAHLYLFGTDEEAVLVGWVAELSGRELETGKMNDGTSADKRRHAGSWPDRVLEIGLGGIRGGPVLRDWQDRDMPLEVRDGRIRLALTPWPQYIHGLEQAGNVALQASRINSRAPRDRVD